MVYSMGELTLVEIGKADLLASVRTEFTSRHLLRWKRGGRGWKGWMHAWRDGWMDR